MQTTRCSMQKPIWLALHQSTGLCEAAGHSVAVPALLHAGCKIISLTCWGLQAWHTNAERLTTLSQLHSFIHQEHACYSVAHQVQNVLLYMTPFCCLLSNICMVVWLHAVICRLSLVDQNWMTSKIKHWAHTDWLLPASELMACKHRWK